MPRSITTILSMVFAISTAFLAGCGGGGGGGGSDSSSTSGGSGTVTGTGTYETNATRSYRVDTSWTPDLAVGVAIGGVRHPVHLANLSERTVARTVNSRFIWSETTSSTITTISGNEVHLVTALPSCSYKDDLYATTAITGTPTLTFEPILHQMYVLSFTFPIATNADGITSIKMESPYLSPIWNFKHYSGPALNWTLTFYKGALSAEQRVTNTTYNPIIQATTWTDGASSSSLVITVNRATTGGSVKIIDNATNEIMKSFSNTTLVAGTAPDSTVSVDLGFVRPTASVYRVVYADPDGTADLVNCTQGSTGTGNNSFVRPHWP